MPTIKILSESVANKIAAGEVIERPASIVKELVENSLDAGAKHVEVEIAFGGKSQIRVSDDGCGMSAEDAALAFKRYATSKIEDAEDLFEIKSFGFRGEALPSIAAVSRVKLTTRAKSKGTGTEISIEGGKLSPAKEAPCKQGTTIEVRDLFFNTPARRKFLKSDATEAGHIYETVATLAFSRPDVGFTYKEGSKTIFELIPGESLKNRAAAIWGPETAASLLEVNAEISTVRIHGLIAKPHAAKSNRSGQVFFINNRWVKSVGWSYALQAGYHGLLMHGRYPVSILFVDLDLKRVDVNVHPTKQEVRISNEAEVKSIIKDAVSLALASKADIAPQLRMPAAESSAFIQDKVFVSYSQMDLASVNPAAVAEKGRGHYPVQEAAPLEDAILIRNKLKITKVLGQIHQTFIVAETEEGLVLIDQHAAHERVMFESLMRNFKKGTPASQGLLMDDLLTVTAKQREILKKSLTMLRKTGFDIEEFGDNTFAIRGVPAIMEKENPLAVLRGYLEEKEDGKTRTSLENHQEEIAALIACKKKSVRAHDAMNAVQMRGLLEQLAACDNPFSCPHGRPSFLKYTFEDLEKQFKRKL